MLNDRMFWIRMMAVQQSLRRFRYRLGFVRQENRLTPVQDSQASRMQSLCGEIERTLYRCNDYRIF